MKTGKQIFFSFEHSKNIPKTSTLKCHHNKIHELYSSFFFLSFFFSLKVAALSQLFLDVAVSRSKVPSGVPV